MKMEKLSETISHDGLNQPGMKEYALEYMLLDDDYDRGTINQEEHHEKRLSLIEETGKQYGSDSLFFDWMEETGITGTDNSFFSKALSVTRLKSNYELTIDDGLIFFETPKPADFDSFIERFEGMGLSRYQAQTAAESYLQNVIIINEKHQAVKYFEKMVINQYRPRSLREVAKIWDNILAGN